MLRSADVNDSLDEVGYFLFVCLFEGKEKSDDTVMIFRGIEEIVRMMVDFKVQ